MMEDEFEIGEWNGREIRIQFGNGEEELGFEQLGIMGKKKGVALFIKGREEEE